MRIRYIIFEPDSYDNSGNKKKKVISDILELPLIFTKNGLLNKEGSDCLHKVAMFKDNGYGIEVEFIGGD